MIGHSTRFGENDDLPLRQGATAGHELFTCFNQSEMGKYFEGIMIVFIKLTFTSLLHNLVNLALSGDGCHTFPELTKTGELQRNL